MAARVVVDAPAERSGEGLVRHVWGPWLVLGDVGVGEELAERVCDCGASELVSTDCLDYAWAHARPMTGQGCCPAVVSMAGVA